MTTPKLDMEQARAICEAATPAPWFNGSDPSHFDAPEITDRKTFAYYIVKDEDAAFCAFARSALPVALDRVEELERLLAEACEIAWHMLPAIPDNIDDRARINEIRTAARIAESKKEKP